MAKPKVFVTRNLFPEVLNKIAGQTQMDAWPDDLPPSYETLLKKVQNIAGLATMQPDRIDANLMDSAPGLKIISTMAVGYDNIDVASATKRHIYVTNTPGVLTETTADFVFALLMAAARRVVEADNYTRKGMWKTWGPMELLGQDIHHATLGIIGLGRIGLEVAKRARGFDMKVLYQDQVRRSPADEKKFGIEFVKKTPDLLANSDFVTLHVPLTPDTRHLFGEKEFNLMKPTAVFINASRGPVVDQKALYEALKSKRIFSAGIDVTEKEPIPMDDPLLTLDNFVIAPHIASASFPTRRAMAMMMADNLLAGLRGEVPPNCITP
jgi:glyoxylate reductase